MARNRVPDSRLAAADGPALCKVIRLLDDLANRGEQDAVCWETLMTLNGFPNFLLRHHGSDPALDDLHEIFADLSAFYRK